MVKIYIFELTLPICDKDKSFILSELESSEIKMLPNHRGRNFELSLIGKILAKKIISNETLTSVKNILIGKNKLGKPIIIKPGNLKLDLSISHSGNYLVIGICDNGKIGVDIELIKNIDFGVFRNCLSTSEEIYINSSKNMKQKIENFYEIWTRKEAYLKALGIGLVKPLPTTQFYPGNIKPKVVIQHNNQRCYFSTSKEDMFILTVCTIGLNTRDRSYVKLTPEKLKSFVTNRKITNLND